MRTVGKSQFNIVANKVNYRIEALLVHILVEQVNQTVLRLESGTVEVDYKSGVQVNVVFKH